MAEAYRDGDEVTLKLSLREAVVVQVLAGAAVPSDTEEYTHTREVFYALEDHLYDSETHAYWERVYDALGEEFEYVFKKEQ